MSEDVSEQTCEEQGDSVPSGVRERVQALQTAIAQTPPAARRGETPLWERWVRVLVREHARILWTTTGEVFFSLPTGEVMAVNSDVAALWLQRRTDRSAGYRSGAWNRAADGLRSWSEEHGTPVTVHYGCYIDWERLVAYIGVEGGQFAYRITAQSIERVGNGTDDVLILGGYAPVLPDGFAFTGELARWLVDDTWMTPRSAVTAFVLTLMYAFGARAFRARPLTRVIGSYQGGKTTRLQMLGGGIYGRPILAQAINGDNRENQSRIANEPMVIYDNLETAPRGYSVEDHLAVACTAQTVSVRKMRCEAEVVEKPITAFVVTTSFSDPACLKRGDVISRSIPVEFLKPEDQEVMEDETSKPIDRAALWCDILLLLQRVMAGWSGAPSRCEHRSVQFVRMAHTVLGASAAKRLEQELLCEQSLIAGLDDPLLGAITNKLPTEPMSSKDLFEYLWPHEEAVNSISLKPKPSNGLPSSPTSLGAMLRHRAGRLGNLIIKKSDDKVANVTLWAFTKAPAVTERADGGDTLWNAILTGFRSSVQGVTPVSPANSGGNSGA